ncbi:MAG: hypothetical protein ACREBG_14365 [Pyrinomonadaceae bacterium]
MTEVEFLRRVNDLLTSISLDVGIEISRVSSAMIPHYAPGQWLYDIDEPMVTIWRWASREPTPDKLSNTHLPHY